MEKYLNQYIKELGKEHSRLKSWEFIYGYVMCNRKRLLSKELHEKTALHLGYYLASWGMFRGGGELLYKNLEYFEYLSVLLFEKVPKKHPSFYKRGFNDFEYEWFQEEFDEVVSMLRKEMGINPTDVLISKILLGVWGEVPALDRYFKIGYKAYIGQMNGEQGLSLNRGITLNAKSMNRLLSISQFKKLENRFLGIQFKYKGKLINYPHAKKIDMAFWRYGLNLV